MHTCTGFRYGRGTRLVLSSDGNKLRNKQTPSERQMSIKVSNIYDCVWVSSKLPILQASYLVLNIGMLFERFTLITSRLLRSPNDIFKSHINYITTQGLRPLLTKGITTEVLAQLKSEQRICIWFDILQRPSVVVISVTRGLVKTYQSRLKQRPNITHAVRLTERTCCLKQHLELSARAHYLLYQDSVI